MTVSLSPELENFINEKVSSGAYSSPDDVIGDSLRRFQEQETMQEADREHLRREIQKGIDCFARGEYAVVGDESPADTAAKIVAESKRRQEAKQAKGIK